MKYEYEVNGKKMQSDNPHDVLIAYTNKVKAEEQITAEARQKTAEIETKQKKTTETVVKVATFAAVFIAANYIADSLLKWAGIGDGSI